MKKLLVLMSFMPIGVWADVSSDLNNFYDSLGYASNVTSPHAYQGQQAGYYSGGSLYVRAKSRDISPLQLSLPRFTAGCGGIDTFMGGFSFINTEELVKFGNNIMSNAAPYFFQLALSTYMPQANDVMNRLQYWAQQMNQFNLNSCESAQALLGGLIPKNTAMQAQICRDLSVQQGKFSDWAAGRQGCGAGGQAQQVLSNQTEQKKQEMGITDNTNLVWSLLKNRPFLSSDEVLAEFFMSLSGTVVFKNEVLTAYPSLVSNELITALLEGKEAKVYHCQNNEYDKCLNLTVTTLSLAPSAAFTYKVEKMLNALEEKLKDDTVPLSLSEMEFIGKTSLPIFKFIQVSLMSGATTHNLEYASLIAQDMVAQYLYEVLDQVERSLASSNYGEAKKEVENGLAKAKTFIRDMDNKAQVRAIAITNLIQNSMENEKLVAGKLSGQLRANLEY